MADKETVDPELDEQEKLESKEDDEGGDDSTTEKKESSEESDEDEESKEEEEESSESKEEEQEEEVPVRNSIAQNIIARQKRTIEKLRSKEAPAEEANNDEESDLTPEAQRAISREVDRRTKPLLDIVSSRASEDELQALYHTDSNAKKYDKRIRAYMAHEAYAQVPPDVIYNHLSAKDRSEASSKRKDLADREARQTRTGGSTRRPTAIKGDIPSVEEQEEMSDEDFGKLQDDVRAGKYLKSTE